ncbi:DHHA1 domain protein [uncultured archaeon]|nr:DHHA1 domain protein [uncultured archaeon]
MKQQQTQQRKDDFFNDLTEFSKKILAEKEVLVIGHHDCDGITATAIAVDFLRWGNVKADFMSIKQLDNHAMQKISHLTNSTLLFVDLGSGQLPALEEAGFTNFYVIDHHPPERPDDPRQINPHPYGFDGGFEVSGAGMVYLVARQAGRREMAHAAVVGAVGDMQDSGGKLHSLNRLILDDAIEQGTIAVKHDLRLFGRQSRSLPQMLAYSNDPFLPHLTGNPSACEAFLKEIGVNTRQNGTTKSYVDLTHQEKEHLTTQLYINLLDAGTPEFLIQRMVGEVYTLLKEPLHSELRDAQEYSTVLNACGRHENAETGVAVVLGDRQSKWAEAKNMLNYHREMLKQGIDFVTQNGAETHPHLYFFNGTGKISENIIGIVAGMAYGARVIKTDKPVLALAEDKDDLNSYKISARATWDLVHRGIHLGDAMRNCSRQLGGEGGGHDIAAGARVPKEQLQKFIELVDDTFKQQRENKNQA